MNFAKTITVPANTAINAPVEHSWNLKAGTLENIEINLPPGSQGLMGIAVFYYDQQIFPFDRGEWITGNRIQIRGVCETPIQGENTELLVRCYNIDVLYDHQFTITANVKMETEEDPLYIIVQQLQLILTTLQLIDTRLSVDKYAWLGKEE